MNVDENRADDGEPTLTDAAASSSDTTPLATTELSLTEADEKLPVQTESGSDMVVQREDVVADEPPSDQQEAVQSQTELVPVEPLGSGIVTMLADAVGQVVDTTATVRQAASSIGSGKKPSQQAQESKPKQKKPLFPALSKIPSIDLKGGAKSVASGIGEIAQNSANVVTGLVGCLQASFSCMGKVIMNPSKKHYTSSSRAQPQTSQPVLTDTPATTS